MVERQLTPPSNAWLIRSLIAVPTSASELTGQFLAHRLNETLTSEQYVTFKIGKRGDGLPSAEDVQVVSPQVAQDLGDELNAFLEERITFKALSNWIEILRNKHDQEQSELSIQQDKVTAKKRELEVAERNLSSRYEHEYKLKEDELVASLAERETIVSEREEKAKQDIAEIKDYKRALPFLFSESDRAYTNKETKPFPADLAKHWHNALIGSGQFIRRDLSIGFLLSLCSALYSGSIVLLNGPVGVGKTSLVRQSAKLLGGRSTVVAVRPAWIDPTDLLGFFDPINSIYRPSPFLTALEKHREDNLHLVCLDELNLAKIENYAADLLSCMEYSRDTNEVEEKKHKNAQERISLYAEAIYKQLVEEAKDLVSLEEAVTSTERRRRNSLSDWLPKYPADFLFPSNTVVIGTLNADESTYDLSPKMIDRSYVITFPPTNFAEAQSTEEAREWFLSASNLARDIAGAMQSSQVKTWNTVASWNQELQRFGIPLGYRTQKDFMVFEAVAKLLQLDTNACLGHFLFAKILPRISFFKEQDNNSGHDCETWLEDLQSKYEQYGPSEPIASLIQQCKSQTTDVVRYWNKI